ncbi:MAG: Trk family potassium uptake protein [SAR202 cluster bacterium]|nr:Trk family potassium uptake protein [SAR202 cluster bacterium]
MNGPWRKKPADSVVHRPRVEQTSPVHIQVEERKPPSRALATPLLLVYGIAALVLIGTLLLLLPVSHNGPGWTPFMVAFFTGTSAASTTGLAVVDSSSYWSPVGHLITMVLIFVGGLGLTTMASFLLIMFGGGRATIAQGMVAKESIGVSQFGGLAILLGRIIMVYVAIQAVGFVLLTVRFSFLLPLGEAVWQAAFHSVSAFNNGGFVILPFEGGLASQELGKDIWTLGIFAALIVLGGISFWVMADLGRARRFHRVSLNTKLVLSAFALLTVAGTLVFFSGEYTNPQTLGPMSIKDKTVTAVFHAVSARTASLQTISFGETQQQTNFFFLGLMFVGAASASAGGGIKVNTFMVVFLAVLSSLRGRSRTTAFRREVPQEQVMRAAGIAAIALSYVFFSAFVLSFLEHDASFITLFFEAVSAFGTVGFGSGVTETLSVPGQLIIIVTMFVGDIGPLTLATALITRTGREQYRYVPERVTLG